MKELDGGYGHMGMQNDTVLYFGLGACDTVPSITVRWPNQALEEQKFTGVATGRFVELRQGDAKVYEVAK